MENNANNVTWEHFFIPESMKTQVMEGMEIVLIEDDEEAAGAMLKYLRANYDSQIRYFQDGEQAAEFLLFQYDNTPMLVLLDVILPYIDGVDLFNMIRLEPKRRNISVVFLIDNDSTKSYLEGLGLKPDGYMKKPLMGRPPVRL